MTKVKSTHGSCENSHKNEKNCSIGKKKNHKFKKLSKGVIDLVNDSQTRSNHNAENQKNRANLQMHTKLPKDENNKQFASPKVSNCELKFPSMKLYSTDKHVVIKEEPSSSDDGDGAVENRGIKMIKGLKQKIKEEPPSSDDGDAALESRGIKMIKGLKQKIKEESSSGDDGHAAVEDRSIKMIEGLKQEIKEEPSCGGENDDDDDDAYKNAGENRGKNIFTDLKQEIKEEPTSNDDVVDDNADENVVENRKIKMIEVLKQEIKEEPSSGDNDDEDGAVQITGIKMFEGLKREIKDEPLGEDDEDTAAELSPSKVSKAIKTEKGSEKDAAKKNHGLTKKEKKERDKRTVFIGNVSIESDRSALQKPFRKFGIIESMRVRGIVPQNPDMPLKFAAIRKKNHPMVKTVCYFITYEKEDSVKHALSMNGKKWTGNILRVDHCNKTEKPDQAKAVFLGNLPFTIEDNEIWERFKECGRINSIRLIRHRKTGLGRGIGYINFESADGAVLALDLNGTTIRNREIRVKPTNPKAISENRKKKRKLETSLSGTAGRASAKKLRTEGSESVEIATNNTENAERPSVLKGEKKRSRGERRRAKLDARLQGKGKGQYQEQTISVKKKPKQDKSVKKKKAKGRKDSRQPQDTCSEMSTASA